MSILDSFDREWERKFSENNGGKSVPPTKSGWTTGRLILTIAGALALFIIINVSKGFYTEWLWFDSLGYGDVYTTMLQTKVLLFFAVAIVFFALFFGNFVLATRLAPKTEARSWPWSVIILIAALLSLISGLWAQANWQVVLRFFNGQPFGISDPVFHGVSFYIQGISYCIFLLTCLTVSSRKNLSIASCLMGVFHFICRTAYDGFLFLNSSYQF